MCKLFAWQGERKLNMEEKQKVKRLIKGLLIAGGHILSNPHGTGLFLCTNNRHILIKRKEDSLRFLIQEGDMIDFWFYHENIKLVMGHMRFATSGVISKENAHPYRFSEFTGMHNGVLDVDVLKKLARKEGVKAKKTDNDTRICFRLINTKIKEGFSLEEALEYFIKNNDIGDYTFIFYWNEKLWFIRHSRPLVGYKTSLGTFLVSTEEMWEKSKELSGLQFKERKIEIKEDILYIIQGEEIKEVSKIKPPRPPQPVYRYNYGSYGYEKNNYDLWNWDWDRTQFTNQWDETVQFTQWGDFSYEELEDLLSSEDLTVFEKLDLLDESINEIHNEIRELEELMVVHDLIDDPALLGEIAEKKRILKTLRQRYKKLEQEVMKDVNKKMYLEYTRSI